MNITPGFAQDGDGLQAHLLSRPPGACIYQFHLYIALLELDKNLEYGFLYCFLPYCHDQPVVSEDQSKLTYLAKTTA